ncbi:helix-turn-helix domain-containing protein [Embleya sp. NBC_00896]|uniref:helix-turn-helix domain-containing protein n=1 Tax=Embleya sp. NBC_00896 TaxID=2975961 RepID=UPI00386B3E71|nr:helix-turn-helix domain-containing protein [Embleya sp. NBC_00896]
MPNKSPVSRPRRRIAALLTDLREQSGLTLEEAAAELGWHISKVNRISLGRRAPSETDIRQLVEFYGQPEAMQKQLNAWREEDRLIGRKAPWWKPYTKVLSAAYLELILNEHDASHAWEFQLNTIPGLCQTDEYARAIISVGLNAYGPDQIATLATVRTTRQKLLSLKSDPLVFTGIVTEGALRAQVGGTDVMRRQLAHLLALAGKDNVRILVIPFTAGAAVAQNSGVTMFRFPDKDEPEIAFLEVIGNTVVEEAQLEISQFTRLFRHLETEAASPADSIALIERAMKEMA